MAQRNAEIKRVLIANRGEIARRIIRTCHALGIETVAVYSDVDSHMPFVREATYSEPIGIPTAYLSIETIVAAAKKSGADSVHPGYGFLSENPAFAEALEKAGITFIGPSSKTIRALGSKTGAKEIAKRANVPVSPTLLLSGNDAAKNSKLLEEFATKVGYPVIIKAAAGGGGRGMRLVTSAGDCKPELESAAREAQKAFGSPEIFVEKYIAPARHIEVQIAGDSQGHVVALGTRDCSLQRSNQKILEEAPATGLKPGVTEELCEAACRLAKEAGYSNLGTVEFLYTSDGHFYFLEVNTRLQVEHPVTEMVTGLDLVQLQIEIARGGSLEKLLGPRSTIEPCGHAIEARLCAEEYTGRFASATGVILDMSIPSSASKPGTIRADMGYEVCSEVSHYYDSLLGKIIVHAEDRTRAIELLDEVLHNTRVSGVATNRALLIHLASKSEFRNQTHTIQGTAELLPTASELTRSRITSLAIVSALRLSKVYSCWASSSPWRSSEAAKQQPVSYPYSATVHGVSFSTLSSYDGDSIRVTTRSGTTEAEDRLTIIDDRYTSAHSRQCTVSINWAPEIHTTVLYHGDTTWVHTPTDSLVFTDSHSRGAGSRAEEASSETRVTSPIPGKVAALNVAKGDSVQEGAILLVLDSMKMEHPFRASRDGKVIDLQVKEGSIVQAGSTLLVLGDAS
jgi:acetyl/propionyl-CoA carboxylase alpha subunit